MVVEILATARDWSVILLVLEFLVLGAVPLVILYLITKGLRSVLRQARPFLHNLVAHVQQGLGYVEFALGTIARPFIWLHTRFSALSAFWRRLRGSSVL